MPIKTKKKSAVKKQIKVNKLTAAICAVLAISVAVSSIILSQNHEVPSELYSFGKSVAKGIDVSEHNGSVDWEMVKKEYDFAFIRVGCRGFGEGNIVEDKNARENMKAAEKAGVVFGVYFYTQATTPDEAEDEANFVLNIIKHYDVKLPVIIDYEYASDSDGNLAGRLYESKLSGKESAKLINAFFKRVNEKGYTFGVYASSSTLKNDIDMSLLDKQALVWVAEYSDSLSYNAEYTVWQYSKTGQSDAVGSKYVDLDYWYE